MAIKYPYFTNGTSEGEQWQKRAYGTDAVSTDSYLENYKAAMPGGVTRIETNYNDHFTDEMMAEATVKVANNSSIHSDRLTNFATHPVNGDSEIYYSAIDDTQTSNNMDTAYFTADTWRDANNVGDLDGIVMELKTQAELEVLGFVFEE